MLARMLALRDFGDKPFQYKSSLVLLKATAGPASINHTSVLIGLSDATFLVSFNASVRLVKLPPINVDFHLAVYPLPLPDPSPYSFSQSV